MLALPSAAAFPGRDKSHCKRQLVADSWLLKVRGGGTCTAKGRYLCHLLGGPSRSVTNINEVVPGTRLDIGSIWLLPDTTYIYHDTCRQALSTSIMILFVAADTAGVWGTPR
jgi:hypothetical protein